EFLGFTDFIPPFTNISGSDIRYGVNYASGSAGISFETGKHMVNIVCLCARGDNVPLRLQLIHHNIIVSKIALMLGGSNDYINNYYMPQYYPTSRPFNPEQYA
ncbi:hypothetical protein TSUD_383970, partial [Trifolium subterraneum]